MEPTKESVVYIATMQIYEATSEYFSVAGRVFFSPNTLKEGDWVEVRISYVAGGSNKA